MLRASKLPFLKADSPMLRRIRSTKASCPQSGRRDRNKSQNSTPTKPIRSDFGPCNDKIQANTRLHSILRTLDPTLSPNIHNDLVLRSSSARPPRRQQGRCPGVRGPHKVATAGAIGTVNNIVVNGTVNNDLEPVRGGS